MEGSTTESAKFSTYGGMGHGKVGGRHRRKSRKGTRKGGKKSRRRTRRH
jgi:hypothetical protein